MNVNEQQRTVAKIIERADASRLEMFGGYPSQYVIENDKVYWADYDAGKEYAAVELTVLPIAEFIEQHYEWLEDR